MPEDSALIVVQARLGSTRLPGKVLLPLGRRCVLDWVLDRLGRVAGPARLVVATSVSATDDPLVEYCRRRDVACVRGSEHDVLGRFVTAMERYPARWIVRVNADNPLIDPAFVDELLAFASRSGCEYASFRRGDGRPVMLTALSFFAEVLSDGCLDRAHREISDSVHREHVTLGIYTQPERFDVRWLDVPAACNDPRLRFTLDTAEDLKLLGEVFAALGDRAEEATAVEVLAVAAEHPAWLETMAALNQAHPKSRAAT